MEDEKAPYRRLRDPRELAALAHPVRIGIIEQLSVSGPLTATELADRLGESPANCSWHLRKLAEHGFVEEAEGGTGRKRPWQVPSIGFSWSAAEASPEEVPVGTALERMMLERQLDRYHDARQRLLADGPEWQKAASMMEHASWLTAAELGEVNEALMEVLERHMDRLTDAAQRPAGSRLCEFVAWGVPIDVSGFGPTRGEQPR